MKTFTNILLIASVGVLASGCMVGENHHSASAAKPVQATDPSTALNVAARAGDVAPTALHTRAALPVVRSFVAVTQAANPREAINLDEGRTSAVVTTESMKFVAKEGAATQTFALDNTEGESYLFLGPQVTGDAAMEAALRGITVLDPTGHVVNVRAPKALHVATDTLPMSTVSLGGLPTGIYTVKADAAAVKAGVALDVRQPKSKIALSMRPSTYEHLLGNSDTVEVQLTEGAAPITGQKIVGTLLDPQFHIVRTVTFSERGQGAYVATIDGAALTAADPIGAWIVDINVEGSAPSGAAYQRTGRVGFHFGIPTAKVSGFGTTRVIKDAKGTIEAFELDVNVESTTFDRLELSAMLTTREANGLEHPVAAGFVGDAYDPGKHMLTIRFDAAYVRMTHLEGSYAIRNVKLFSLGTDTLFFRSAEVPVASFAPIKTTELKAFTTLSPALQQLVDDGVLFAR